MTGKGRPQNFTLRQLDIFVAAARSGSFALAADRFGISQPAVSDHVRTLEHHLGQRLFDRRRGTTAMLTQAGEELLERAIGLLSASDSLRHERPARARDERALVRLSVTPRIRDAYVKPLLARLFRELPGVDVTLCPAMALHRCTGALEAGEIDLIVGSTDRLPPDLPNMHILHAVPLVMIAAPPVAARIALGDPALAQMPIILPSYAQAAESWLQAQLRQGSLHRRRPIRFVEFTDVIQTLVEEEAALAILLEEEIGPAIAAGRFIRLGPRLEPMLRVIARSPRAPRAAEALEKMLIHAIGSRPVSA